MIITDVQSERAAQHYFVFTVHTSSVFRFARDQQGAEALVFEARSLLPAVCGSVRLPVPKPIYESLERLEPGYAFIGYQRLEGEPLWPETLEPLEGAEAWEAAAETIAGFLRELHAVELPQAAVSGRENRDAVRLPLEELAARVREELFPSLSEEARKLAARDLAALESGREAAGQALVHGALGPAHLLWDAEEASVCGAIGFGSARIDEPAVDFAGLLAIYGAAFYERCLISYGSERFDRIRLDNRARCYARLLPLREALYGLDTGDEETLRYGLAVYEQEAGA